MTSPADIQHLRDELAAQQLLVQQQSAEVARLQGLVDTQVKQSDQFEPLPLPSQFHHRHRKTILPSGFSKFQGTESYEKSKIWIEFATFACKTYNIATLGWRSAIILPMEGNARLWGLQYHIDNPVPTGADPETIFNGFKEAFMDQYSAKEDFLYLRAEWNAVEWNSGESPHKNWKIFSSKVRPLTRLTANSNLCKNAFCDSPEFHSTVFHSARR
ncbi:hypothetical protein BG000_002259 [Podila horticola]|nr:hypothetical protein BG000_002259 [Podila horticola]